ncbi:MAG: DUF885 family protein [Planctomycetota bacterium]
MRTVSLLCLAMVLAACAADDTPPPLSADQQYAALASEYIDGYFAFRPVYASRLGVHKYEDRLPDYSPRAVEEELLRIDQFREKLSSIPAGGLSPLNLADLEALKDAIDAWYSRLTQKPVFKRDPLFYNDLIVESIELVLRRDYAPAAIRMEALVARLQQVPRLLDAARVNLTEVPEVLRAASEAPLINAMHMLRERTSSRILTQMSKQLPEHYEAALINAVNAYVDFYLFVARPLKRKTVDSCSFGRQLFFERWRQEESISSDVESMLELCASSREIVLERMKEVALLINPEKSMPEILVELGDHHESVKGTTDRAAQAAEQLKEFVRRKDLLTLPEEGSTRLKIMDPDPRTYAILSILPPGVFDAQCGTGYVSVNPIPPFCEIEPDRVAALRFFTPYSIALLITGAAIPGNFTQTIAARGAGTLVREISECVTCSQGWAQYCREMIIDAGFDPRPEALLIQLHMNLMEINRLELSTRIHCLDLSTEAAIEFLLTQSFITAPMARRELIDIVRDTKAGAGFVGGAQILQLRDLYLSRDERRTLKSFHDLLLSSGQAPISILAGRLFGESM